MGILNKLVTSFAPTAPLEKAWKEVSPSAAKRQPIAMELDPMSLSYSMGYKDRRTNMTYEILRQVSLQLSILGAIINTRVNQVAAFSAPFRQTRTLGFEIKHKDRDHKLSKSEKRFVHDLERFVSLCGKDQPNPYHFGIRDNFDQFTRKVIRDRLVYDSMTWEIVPDRRGDPFEFVAVDASTIRLAMSPNIKKKKLSEREFVNLRPFIGRYDTVDTFDYPRTPVTGNVEEKAAGYVQVWNGTIKRAFTLDELAFSIANPRTDIRNNGYGFSEIEQLIMTITSQLWAEEYNRNFFKQGASPKGILNIRGDNIAPEQLEAFRRAWTANVSGVENSWRTPVLQSEEIQYVNMQSTNMEMEYSRWMEYLIKVICSVYLIAPEEIGFSFTAGGMQQPVVETNNEWRLKASKDRGLRPLLKFYSESLNRSVIDKIDNNFFLDFVGLDELTERERIELRQQQVQFFRTVNEIRKDEDLEELDDGDILLNPAYLQYVQMQHQWKTEKEQLDLQKQQMQMQQQQMDQQQQMQEKQMSMQEQAAQAQMGGAMGGPGGESGGGPGGGGPAGGGAPPEGGGEAPPAPEGEAAPEEGAPVPPEGGPEAGGVPPEGPPPEGPPPEAGAEAGGVPPEAPPPEAAPALPPEAGGAGAEPTAVEEETVSETEEVTPEGEVTEQDIEDILASVPPEAIEEFLR
jgi:HK97 family phage portal protein